MGKQFTIRIKNEIIVPGLSGKNWHEEQCGKQTPQPIHSPLQDVHAPVTGTENTSLYGLCHNDFAYVIKINNIKKGLVYQIIWVDTI